MKNVFSTKRLCRAGVIAALYVAITYAFMPFAFGPFQIRPAEALCILPLFFPEAVPALWVGCMLSNFASPYFVYDVLIGSLATLFAAFGTYLVGRFFKKNLVKLLLGGLFPVLFNALLIPLIIVFLCGGLSGQASVFTAYAFYVGSFLLTETVWVYGLGTPLYFLTQKLDEGFTR
ncbi:MAG: QueT transporter family protein [Clostridia bacterium]|nr:QueT transporter family protein [Clostridia bacterium]